MHIWARGYCVSTVGLNNEVIREYVSKQQEEEIKEEQRRLWKDNSGGHCQELLSSLRKATDKVGGWLP